MIDPNDLICYNKLLGNWNNLCYLTMQWYNENHNLNPTQLTIMEMKMEFWLSEEWPKYLWVWLSYYNLLCHVWTKLSSRNSLELIKTVSTKHSFWKMYMRFAKWKLDLQQDFLNTRINYAHKLLRSYIQDQMST